MSILLIDITFALLAASAGFGAACYLKRSARDKQEEQINLAEMAIARLHDLTKRISADVVDHNTRVQQISDELSKNSDLTPENLAKVLHTLLEFNSNMTSRLASAQQRLKDQAREIESHVAEARTDALTGLNNRRVFNTEMERGYEAYQRRGRPLSLMMLDIDDFKQFNDRHGHQAGDEVLRAVGQMLIKAALPEHIVCRYGGEEFAILFPGSTIADSARIAESIRSAIAESAVEFEGLQLQVTASGGLAQLLPNEGVDDLIRRTDEALYASKEEGRNRTHGHDGELFYPLEDLLDSLAEVAASAVVSTPETDSTAPLLELAEQTEVAPTPLVSNSRIDRLSGLSNMETFRDDLQRRLSETKRSGVPISMLVARIDEYEALLTRHNPKSTQMVLRAAAQFFKATMREMDHLACDDDDSFALLLPTAKLDNAMQVAERLRGAVYRCKLPLGGKPFQFTMSFGVAQAEQGECTETLIQRCKAAQCQAVQLGGNQAYADSLELEPAAS